MTKSFNAQRYKTVLRKAIRIMQMFPKIENGRKSHLSDLTSQLTQLNPFSGFSWVLRVIFNFGISFRCCTFGRIARSSKFQPKK